ncbi:hypothetical protein KBB96_09585 [Luteolibacter ambystomatis]|uniref:Novel STAND NTPase 1 domain-containing protein n=1 Tax=Luteolibacter ambystomatis TaxID=2824561 RepID=A0A975J356_9BACT|nr:hypothetical protein [Luteolibacter ambystomatis]QUE53131.1 hypothetical protein KBB96_09585 [Luteolibacter ambystomatis]
MTTGQPPQTGGSLGANPYRGVHPFSSGDNDYFAGRGSEIQIVISKLYGSKLTVLYGESGCGKTSLIRAGVIPELQKPEHRVAVLLFRDWQSPDFAKYLRHKILEALLEVINRLRKSQVESVPDAALPAEITFAELEEALRGALGPDDDTPMAEEAFYGEQDLPLDRFIMECCAVFSGQMFFIFDQFEEYLYYHPEGSPGAAFDAAFARLVNRQDVPASFILSLRDDGLGKLDRLRPRIPYLLGNMYRLEHLTHDGAEEAMTRPLEIHAQSGYRSVDIEPALKDKLLAQIREDRIGFEDVYLSPRLLVPQEDTLRYKALFLQIILTRLWEQDIGKDGGSFLKLATFETLTAEKAEDESEARYLVRTYFDGIMARLTPEQQDDAAEVLRFLIRFGGQKKAGDPRRLAMDAGIQDEGRIVSLLEALALESDDPQGRKMSLLRKVGPPSKPLYEFVHDVMGLALRDWCDRRRDDVFRRRQEKELDLAERRRLQDQATADDKLKASRKLTTVVLIAAAVLVIMAAWIFYSKVQMRKNELDRQAVMSANAKVQEGNTAAAMDDREEAIKAYKEAKVLFSALGKIVDLDPEKQYQEFASKGAKAKARKDAMDLIEVGNDLAKQGESKKAEAIEAYEKAKALLPALADFSPEGEYDRWSKSKDVPNPDKGGPKRSLRR